MHYRKILLLIMTTLLSFSLWAQDSTMAQDTPSWAQDTTIIPGKPDTIITDSELRQMRIRYPDTALQRMLHQLKELKANATQNASAIHGLLQGKEVDNRTKYNLMRTNLIDATRTYYLLNKKIIDLKSRTTTNNLDVFITSLNNPESKALGFSFSERILDLVKNVVLHGKANKNKRNEKIVSTTESILNSPIFKGMIGLTPPLAIANSVMTFFHTLSVNNKQINTETLDKFEKELNKYVGYYTVLNEGNQKFQYGLNFNKDQLNMLQQNMYDHLKFTASALGVTPPKRQGNEPLGITLNRYFLTFNKEDTRESFDKLEKKYALKGTHKVDYEKLLRENMSLKEANNQLEDLVMQTKRFENLYSEYFNLVNNYYDKVVSALNLAQDNGLASKDIVKQKQHEFTNLKQEAVSDIKASINIQELENNTDNIKYRYKIF